MKPSSRNDKNQDPAHQCQYFLTKKKRLCRFRPKPGETYCPEHSCVMGVDNGRKRIPCPLNSKHNCYEDELEKHLKVCNVTKIRQKVKNAVYFSEGINRGTQEDVQSSQAKKVSIKDLTPEVLADLIDRVKTLYRDKVEAVETAIYEHPCVREEYGAETGDDLNDTFGKQAALKKELLQQASLVGQLDHIQCLNGKCCFVELGAGKGKLSHWIQKACDLDGNKFILVERASVRYKMDGFHKKEDGDTNFKRIKIDIEDLNLGPVPEMKNQSAVVVVGKHLCGGATDMGIRCAVNTLNNQSPHPQTPATSLAAMNTNDSKKGEKINAPSLSDEDKNYSQENSKETSISEKVKFAFDVTASQSPGAANTVSTGDESETQGALGEPNAKLARRSSEEMSSADAERLPSAIMIALCCHHRCTWETYTGRKFMTDCGISPQDFDLLTRLSSWATCAKETARSRRIALEKKVEQDSNQSPLDQSFQDQDQDQDHCSEDMLPNCQSNSLRESLSVPEREEIGLKCKRLIDQGRLHYLREKRMHCYLRKYIDGSLTPENIALVAVQKKKER